MSCSTFSPGHNWLDMEQTFPRKIDQLEWVKPIRFSKNLNQDFAVSLLQALEMKGHRDSAELAILSYNLDK